MIFMEEKLKDIDERLDKIEETLDRIDKMMTGFSLAYIQYLDTKIKESQMRTDCMMSRQMNQCTRQTNQYANVPWDLWSL